MSVDFSTFTTEQLLNMTEDINHSVIADDALIRRVASEVYNIKSPKMVHFVGLAVPIVTELARRIRSYKFFENKS